MFIDYLTLLLINMTAGFVLLALFVARGLDDGHPRTWAPGFIVVGAVAFLFGVHMTLTWPLPGAFNIAFGEMSVLFGALFLAAGITLALGGNVMTLAIYAFFAGLAALVLGLRIIEMGLTRAPLLSGIGFVLSGLAGVLAAPTLTLLRANRPFRYAAGAVLLAAAFIWALTGYAALWDHMASFASWRPPTMP